VRGLFVVPLLATVLIGAAACGSGTEALPATRAEPAHQCGRVRGGAPDDKTPVAEVQRAVAGITTTIKTACAT
jgi:hypothetical protein